jgi:dTDP-4-amino-4,6-dideoxygalactose transaminase
MPTEESRIIKETEELLARYFGRKRAFLVGRGATGLMLLYESLCSPDAGVILPAIACPSLLATVLLTGRQAVIVDVDMNLNIDPEQVEKILQPGDVVVGVHLFGIPCAIDELKGLCEKCGAVLIEDLAQAVGGKYKNKLLGSFGIASLMSFAGGKILPTFGGGAILCDDDALIAKLEEKVAKLPERPDDLIDKSRDLRDELTKAFNEARSGNLGAASIWSDLYNAFGPIYSYAIRADECELIGPALESLEENAELRRAKLSIYKEYMGKLDVWFPKYPADCVPYRFSFVPKGLTIEDVHKCTENIRAAGLNASNLYIPLNDLAPDKVHATQCDRAEFVGWHIINLWLDDSVGEDEILSAAEVVSDFVEFVD